jgi:hypothetical protein
MASSSSRRRSNTFTVPSANPATNVDAELLSEAMDVTGASAFVSKSLIQEPKRRVSATKQWVQTLETPYQCMNFCMCVPVSNYPRVTAGKQRACGLLPIENETTTSPHRDHLVESLE